MQEILELSLYSKYPEMFSLKDNKTEPIGAYGIECGDGWYQILQSVCFIVAQHELNIQQNNHYLTENNKETVSYEKFRFTQIKEKFGGLRIYYYGGDDYIRGLIRMAECWRFNTFEKCGERGEPDKSGWITTICKSCKGKI